MGIQITFLQRDKHTNLLVKRMITNQLLAKGWNILVQISFLLEI